MITYKQLLEKCTCWKGYKRKPGTKPCEEGSCVKESILNPKDPHGDYKAKSKALHDLSLNKDVDQNHVRQRKLDLDKEYSSLKKEESGANHDVEHVTKTMKKVDYDTYTKHMRDHGADHSIENKHGVDTQHSKSFDGKIHGAEIGHKHSKSGQKEYYIKG